MKRNLAQIFRASLILLSFSVFSAAQNSIVPIVSLSINDSDSTSSYGNLLGGVENGKWLNAKTTFGKLKGDEKFSLFNFESGKKGEFSLGAIKESPGVCPEIYEVEPQINTAANFAVGANANWEILPRPIKALSLTEESYKKAVADVLRLRGLPKSPAKIKQAVQVDLDGDGKSEVLLVANHYAEDASLNAKVGNYSFLIIRKTIGGKTQNIFVGGNFLKKKSDYYDGEYELSGIADLNGDGKMEILVEIAGYEENWLKIYEMKAGKPSEIKALSYYCGV